MIFITQGHENSIGLEIFIKAMICLNQDEISQIRLIASQNTIKNTLQTLNLKFSLGSSTIKIADHTIFYINIDSKVSSNQNLISLSQTLHSLILGIEICLKSPNSILLTLPTSKDQLLFKNQYFKGHTEFFRFYFKNNFLPMFFKSPYCNLLLITDHISLNELTAVNFPLTQHFFQKTLVTINESSKYFDEFDDVIIAGVNPHAGENGLLGLDERKLFKPLNKLKDKIKSVNFIGPLSGDTLFFKINNHRSQLLVYMYHDQGLTVFKSHFGLIGLNITFGMPFLRISVDHGTAFDLYGKNSANYLGALYMLNEALKIHSKKNDNKKFRN